MAMMVLPLVVTGTADGGRYARDLNVSDIQAPVATVATVSNRSDFALGTVRRYGYATRTRTPIPDRKGLGAVESSRSPATPLLLAARNDDRECYWLGTCGN